MKKILSVLIAAAMLLSTLAVCVLPAVALANPSDSDGEYSATDGQFIISTAREDAFIEDDDRTSRPGGVYTNDGFSVNPLDEEYSDYKVNWPNNAPYFSVQTKQNVYEGFFMEIRIDDFSFWTVTEDEEGNKTYAYTDRWFSFSVWNSVGVMPAQLGVDSNNNDWGNGIETLIRINAKGEPNVNITDPEDYTNLSAIMWYDDTEAVKENTRFHVGNTVPGTIDIREDGKLYLTFELRVDETGAIIPYINGQRAPITGSGTNAKDYITESLADMLFDMQYEAYIGFTLQSAQKDAAASFTVTKIGTTREDAKVPVGEENIEAAQRNNAVAEIEPRDPDADPAEPALLFTGDPDTYKNVRDVSGAAKFEPTPEGFLKITSNNGAAQPLMRPSNDQSFDARDYPVLALIVKNFCTCEWEDIDHDNIPDKDCKHNEQISAIYIAGDHPNGNGDAATGVKVIPLERNVGEDTYSVYVFDMTARMERDGYMETAQRIHALYVQYKGIKYDVVNRNVFEMVAIAQLATEDGAVEWAGAYLDKVVGEENTDTTEAPDGGDTTEAPEGGETTEAPAGGETTEAPSGETTEAPETTDAPAIDIPDADSELSIEQAIAIGSAMAHNTYTEGKYYVTGTVLEVYNEEYGNMKIQDDKGNILTIYGTWSDDGETRYDALTAKPVAGDTVTIYGVVGQYSGTPQIKNGWIVDFVAADSTGTEEKTPDTTEKPDAGETTEKPNTPATTEKPNDKTEEPVKSGCGSVAGFGALAIVAVAAVGLVSFKKKED